MLMLWMVNVPDPIFQLFGFTRVVGLQIETSWKMNGRIITPFAYDSSVAHRGISGIQLQTIGPLMMRR